MSHSANRIPEAIPTVHPAAGTANLSEHCLLLGTNKQPDWKPMERLQT